MVIQGRTSQPYHVCVKVARAAGLGGALASNGRAEMETHQIAVLPRDPVTLADLDGFARDLRDPLELPGRRPDPDNRRDRVAERPWVEIRVIPTDRVRTFEPLHALGDGGCRQPHPTSELGHTETALRMQLTEDAQVHIVEQIRCVSLCISRPCFSRQFALDSVDCAFHYDSTTPTMSG